MAKLMMITVMALLASFYILIGLTLIFARSSTSDADWLLADNWRALMICAPYYDGYYSYQNQLFFCHYDNVRVFYSIVGQGNLYMSARVEGHVGDVLAAFSRPDMIFRSRYFWKLIWDTYPARRMYLSARNGQLLLCHPYALVVQDW